jgi:hypothetical protein
VVSAGSAVITTLSGVTAAGQIDDPSAATSAALSVSDNRLLAQGTGGVTTNRLNVDAGADIVGGTPAAAPVLDTSTGVLTLNADYSVLNVQYGEPDVTSSATGIAVDALVLDDLDGDSVTVSNNLVQSSATGFSGTSILDMSAGASSDATGQVGNVQIVGNSTLSSTASGVQVTSTSDLGALNSSIGVSGNEVSAITTGSTALNGLIASADATLQESSGAGASVDPSAGISVTGADYAVLNSQESFANTLSSSATGVIIGADDLSGANGVNNSSVEVLNNAVLAQTTANASVNQLVLNTGTFQHPSASVANLQTVSGTSVSASVDGAGVGIGVGGGLISATSTNSSFTVRGNAIGATAIGNSVTNGVYSGN